MEMKFRNEKKRSFTGQNLSLLLQGTDAHDLRGFVCIFAAHMCEWCIHDLRWYVCIADAHLNMMHTLLRS